MITADLDIILLGIYYKGIQYSNLQLRENLQPKMTVLGEEDNNVK